MGKTVGSKVHLCPEFRDLVIQFRDHLDDLLIADSDPDGFAHRCDTLSPVVLDFSKYLLIRKNEEIFYEV